MLSFFGFSGFSFSIFWLSSEGIAGVGAVGSAIGAGPGSRAKTGVAAMGVGLSIGSFIFHSSNQASRPATGAEAGSTVGGLVFGSGEG